ncbi:hypothetical protein RFI_03531 [Reticulomyxa filosa]|uniref:CLASP N-terminal domain-containing protein n=1 Tax=Reticulomyxa filosa TaxID=46433 RepID=X6P653_RETFI|nr:hypothetical protein RFI_03531 [Reticulomyxa filosa]|eukprot:ETO33569.1 hypothetical protein RFI_03531 [Reticulomyxa filosa]
MSNEFLGEEADKAFLAMIHNISSNRSLSVLLQQSKHKCPPVRAKVAMYLEKLIEVIGPQIFEHREFEKLITVIGDFVNEGSINIRTHTKQIIARLYYLSPKAKNPAFSKDFLGTLKKSLAFQQYQKISQIVQQCTEDNTPDTTQTNDLTTNCKNQNER